jgi:hypothetical protein
MIIYKSHKSFINVVPKSISTTIIISPAIVIIIVKMSDSKNKAGKAKTKRNRINVMFILKIFSKC